ncbi:MAG: hypothetical protein N2484_05895 [Clostridia bacterium]|nr:hypothetical protein [Clostridia bacterium]
MRTTRVEKFRKKRFQSYRNLFLTVIVLPSACIFLGYLITSLFILPSVTK